MIMILTFHEIRHTTACYICREICINIIKLVVRPKSLCVNRILVGSIYITFDFNSQLGLHIKVYYNLII